MAPTGRCPVEAAPLVARPTPAAAAVPRAIADGDVLFHVERLAQRLRLSRCFTWNVLDPPTVLVEDGLSARRHPGTVNDGRNQRLQTSSPPVREAASRGRGRRCASSCCSAVPVLSARFCRDAEFRGLAGFRAGTEPRTPARAGAGACANARPAPPTGARAGTCARTAVPRAGRRPGCRARTPVRTCWGRHDFGARVPRRARFASGGACCRGPRPGPGILTGARSGTDAPRRPSVGCGRPDRRTWRRRQRDRHA